MGKLLEHDWKTSRILGNLMRNQACLKMMGPKSTGISAFAIKTKMQFLRGITFSDQEFQEWVVISTRTKSATGLGGVLVPRIDLLFVSLQVKYVVK